MNHVAVEDVEGYQYEDGSKLFKSLTGALGVEGLAVNYYEVAQGETIGDCYHRHHEQEELFYVVAGTATFETEGGDVTVETGELIRFAPGDWQQGRNAHDERLVVLAIGAPQDEGPIDLRRHCPECGDRTDAVLKAEDGAEVFYCAECGAETGRYE
ncbi:cupin domain-containing protein [Halomarina salina]|uniref:Cupin domain-containing protein n=1 Tax=Halomarina salina TaxID=1872699 RepID=A0ABD5RQA6_9EURY|nr:cupin domain-containing protein [Halomarina salina]